MQKVLLLLSSLIAGVVSIMQIWMCIIVFRDDYNCRTYFNNANSSTLNEMECISTNSTEQFHCICRYSYLNSWENVDWIRVFDDGSVAMASIIFIMLVIIEFLRAPCMIYVICGSEMIDLTTLQYCSIFGFFALMLNPSSLDKYIPATHCELFMVIIDVLSIGLIFHYCSASEISIYEPFYLTTLILSSCNGLRCIFMIYHINYQRFIEKQNKNLSRQPILHQHYYQKNRV